MKINLLIFICFILVFLSCSNNESEKEKQILTAYDIAGTYEFGSDPEKGAVGSLQVYPLSKEKALFFISVCIGAPSYNLGDIFGEIKCLGDDCEFYFDGSNTPFDCKFKFKFMEDRVKIDTENEFNCQFGGNGVSVNYTFYKKSSKIPSKFTNNTDETFLFEEIDVKTYYGRNNGNSNYAMENSLDEYEDYYGDGPPVPLHESPEEYFESSWREGERHYISKDRSEMYQISSDVDNENNLIIEYAAFADWWSSESRKFTKKGNIITIKVDDLIFSEYWDNRLEVKDITSGEIKMFDVWYRPRNY
jgi:hypothetical protein